MKVSSFFFLGIVLVVFVAIEGWVVARTFVAPRSYQASEALIMGDTIDIRTPVQGVVQEIDVAQGQRVSQGQQLLIVTYVVTDPITQVQHEQDLPITALLPGVMTDVNLTPGMTLQATQKVASIVDNSPDVLYVSAKLSVAPNDVPNIRPLMEAYIRADYLNGGKPVRAVVSSVSPEYNATDHALPVRLRLVEAPPELNDIVVGLPLEAWVQEKQQPQDNSFFVSLLSHFLPSSEARQN